MRFYIVIQGSNDLNSPLKNSLEQLLKMYKSIKYDVVIVYSLIEGLENKLWQKNINSDIEFEKGIYVITNSELFKKEYSFENFDTSLDIKKILELYYEEDETNILIVSGHGGIFQAMLDMSVNPAKSINTAKFCTDISCYKFDLIFLDMCASNYIELIYEILYGGNVERVMTYKNFAHFEGINYMEVIKYFSEKDYENFVLKSKYEMMIFDQESFRIMQYAKKLQSKIGFGMKNEFFTIDDKVFEEFEKVLELVPFLCSKNMKLKDSLRYIKYPLCDDNDKSIYESYNFTKNNEYKNIIVGENFQDVVKDYIVLDKQSILNIIALHNPLCNLQELYKMLDFYIEVRNEKKWNTDM